jgi:hypothetical protein
MVARFFQGLFRGSSFPVLISPTIRLGIIRIKEQFHCLIKSISLREILTFFSTNKALPQNEESIDTHIKLSDVCREQERVLHLTYSVTTALKPVNFDLSIFFATSPPGLNQVMRYAN